jgi:hypothetical protein
MASSRSGVADDERARVKTCVDAAVFAANASLNVFLPVT